MDAILPTAVGWDFVCAYVFKIRPNGTETNKTMIENECVWVSGRYSPVYALMVL